MKHVPVLLQSVVDSLSPALEHGGIFLDGTLGSAGHASEMAKKFHSLTLVGLDRDRSAVERSREKLEPLAKKLFLKEESFRNLDQVLAELGIKEVNAILFDLGLSSDELEDSGRGFSFLKDEPLLMTMSEGSTITARDILNNFDEHALELIIRGFGEERYSRRIAEEIVKRREATPFETTNDLLEVVMNAVPAVYKHGRIHPATRVFQAIRIAVNEELTALEEGLEKGFRLLAPKGRFAVISFHSLEDRIVKNFFRDRVKEGRAKLVMKKPIVASEEENGTNPRARSAKLRVIEKI